MTAISTTAPPATAIRPSRPTALGTATRTLATRRLSLSVRTPRELVIPVMTPLLFAIVIAPALATTFGARPGGVDYMTFVAVSTLGLLIPLSCMSSGLGVVVDRLNGAQRDLLAAPVPKELIVIGNVIVAVLLSALQVAVIIVASWLRGADFTISPGGLTWFVAAALGFAVGMYGVAEILANRLQTRRSTSPRCPVWRSCPTSSPEGSSRSRRCPQPSPSSPSCCRSHTCWPSCGTASPIPRDTGCTTSGACRTPRPWPS